MCLRLSIWSCLLCRCIWGLLGLNPSLPEELVLAIKERIVIPTVQLETTLSPSCTSLEGPFALRRGAQPDSAVGGFAIGNFFGDSHQEYFQAIGRLVGEVRDLAQLKGVGHSSAAAVTETASVNEILTGDYHEVRLKHSATAIEGRVSQTQTMSLVVMQGLKEGQHVWWCILENDRKSEEISDQCSHHLSIVVVDTLRFFLPLPTVTTVNLTYSVHKTSQNVVLVGKTFAPQYAAVSTAAKLTTLAEATKLNMRYKPQLVSAAGHKLQIYEFFEWVTDTQTQTAINKAVLSHLTDKKPLELLLLNDSNIVRKYATFLGERNNNKISQPSKWGAELVERLKQKQKLETLNAELSQALTFLKSLGSNK